MFYSQVLAQNPLQVIKGQVTDASNEEIIPFATIYIPELEKGAVAGSDGVFSLSIPISISQIKLIISCLGYANKEILLNTAPQHTVRIALEPKSFELEDVIVSAEYSKNIGTDAKITEEALEYINPTSLRDLFLLLPGGTIQSNNIHGRSLISFRQAGADRSSSFGVGVSLDGIPLHNDGLRIQMVGYTGKSSIDPSNNVSINTGVDLRTISTDHIESVTITKGITSAKEGNLSSGLIKIRSKKGKTPLQLRTKFDPLNKLFYVGKGFLLSEKMGTIHAGIDVTKSSNDLRNIKSSYNRITSQINYNNQFFIGEKKVDMNLKGSFVSSFNDTKNDEQISILNENYKTNYERYAVSSHFNVNINSTLADNLELLASLDYSKDVLKHNKQVNNMTVMSMQTSQVEGESEGVYLPKSYQTNYEIENKPLNGFVALNAKKYGNLSEKISCNVLLGGTMNYVKNHGRGIIADPTRPPFPDNSYIRARPNNEIPALVNNAYYIEGKAKYKNGNNEIHTSLGLRTSQMLNLPSEYKLNGLLLIEPRLQLSYTLRSKKLFSNTFRIGYGIENKLPSLDYLYPDKLYQDFIVLNAYFNKPENRLLITNTKIYNLENKNIRENKNTKIELGWEFEYKKCNFSLTLFREKMNGGVEYFSEYYPIAYQYYNELKHPVTGKPSKEDYNSYLRRDFVRNKKPTNSAKVIKKGFEYRLSLPKIEAVRSEIEINGAYYHTLYTSGVPIMYRPSITQDNKPYSFVGIYDGFEKNYRERFNTNIWIHTHLPNLKLIFTNFFQFVWLDSYHLGKDVATYPSAYLNFDNEIITTTPLEVESIPYLGALKRTFPESRYNKVKKPISMVVNLKLTKEFGRSVRLSFFANNLLQINPTYKSARLRTQRDWRNSFFGAELILKLR